MRPGESEAELRFAEWLEARELGEAPSWATFLSVHAACRTELENLEAAWMHVRRLFDELVDSEFGAEGGEHGLVRFVKESVIAVPSALDPAPRAPADRAPEAGRELAFETGLRREVVLLRGTTPVPGAPAAREAETEQDLIREARILAQLDHPGIPALHDVWREASGACVLASARPSGRPLREVLTSTPERSLTARIELWLRVAEAVGHAHARGVVHGALDPRVIRVDERGAPTLAGWGAARFVQHARADAAERCTPDTCAGPEPAYAAPELAASRGERPRRNPRPSTRLDVFSLGVLLRELVRGTPAAEPTGPAELISVESRATAISPSDRYSDAAEMIEEVRAFLDGRVVRAHQVGPAAELRAWVRRNRGVAAIGVLSIAALLTYLAGLALFQSRALERERGLQSRSMLASVLARSAALWPPGPERLGELESLVLEARGLRPELFRKRAELAQRVKEVQRAGGAWTEDEVEVAMLAGYVADLEALASPAERDPRSLAGLEWRIRASRAAAARRANPPAAWGAVHARVRQDPRFGGRVPALVPWLEPLGPDPMSGLEEFAHLWTGRVPRRGEDGRLRLEGDSAVVLVLLPEGSVRCGGEPPASPTPEGLPPAAVDLQDSELPARVARLDAYLLGKYELTRGQWRLLTSEEREGWLGEATLLPAGSLRWTECLRVLAQHGLSLPTEAQWEYACRAGGRGLWGLDDPRLELQHHANLSDAKSEALGFGRDELQGPAQVGSLDPNAFALHDMQGNVREWCLDAFATSQLYTVRSGDGLARAPDFGLRTSRGGDFSHGPEAARVSRRIDMQATHASPEVGVRAAMAIRME